MITYRNAPYSLGNVRLSGRHRRHFTQAIRHMCYMDFWATVASSSLDPRVLRYAGNNIPPRYAACYHLLTRDGDAGGPALLEEYLWGHSEDVVDESEFSLYCGCDEMLSTSTACHRSALPAFGFPLGSSWIVVAVVVFLLRR